MNLQVSLFSFFLETESKEKKKSIYTRNELSVLLTKIRNESNEIVYDPIIDLMKGLTASGMDFQVIFFYC